MSIELISTSQTSIPIEIPYVMRSIIQSICFLLVVASLRGQTTAWKPSAGYTQVPIWPGAAPDAQPPTGPEVTKTEEVSQVAGKPWTYVGNVTQPTMTLYSPRVTTLAPQ